MSTSDRVGHFEGPGEIEKAASAVVSNDEFDLVVVHEAVPDIKKLQKWLLKSWQKVGPKPNAKSQEIIERSAPILFESLRQHAIAVCETSPARRGSLEQICYRKDYGIGPHFDGINRAEGRTPVGVIGSLGVISASHFYADKSVPWHVYDRERPGQNPIYNTEPEWLLTKVLQQPNDLVLLRAYPHPTIHAVGLEDPQRQSVLVGYSATLAS